MPFDVWYGTLAPGAWTDCFGKARLRFARRSDMWLEDVEIEELGADVVKVTNLLGGPLTDLQVVDSRGRLFAAQGIADGATCELRPAPATAKRSRS